MGNAELGVGELVMTPRAPRFDREPVEACRPIAIVVARASALEQEGVFGQLPVDPDCCYLIYLLPSASREEGAAFARLPSHHSGFPVVAARAGISLRPAHVFVLSSGRSCTLNGTRFVAAVRERERAAPLDTILCAAAQEYGQQAIVVLTAPLGVDGSDGLDAIREAGGTVVAQDELGAEAAHPSGGAPSSADGVAPMGVVSAALTAFLAHLREHSGEGPLTHEAGLHLDGVLTWVRTKTGHDFSQYKRSTVIRRVRRRMAVARVDSLEGYLEYLKIAPAEAEHLLEDMLIGVTRFFRDPDAFNLLAREAIPALLAGKAAGGTVRIWVPGCASGEEAYSLAFLFMDFIESNGLDVRLQVFATDIDDEALRAARRATYPAATEAHIPRDLLRRYMNASEGVLRISKRIRDCVIFSSHNVIKDTSFSNLDLISCRNLLIYLSSEVQSRLIALLHYALLPGGYLFLGPDEGLGAATRLFSVTHKKQRIFQRRAATSALGFPSEPVSSKRRSETRRLLARAQALPSASKVAAHVERMLLQEYAPACVVINEQLTVVHSLGNTSDYLQSIEGPSTLDLLDLARHGLRTELQACVHQAATQQAIATRTGVELTVDGQMQRVDIVVKPLADAVEAGLYLVTFQETDGAAARLRSAEVETNTSRDARIEQLELGLKRTRAQLHTVIEEFEASNEELKSSNEELLSMNEELQASNEELETAKEELQSVNEKLERVNAELESKVDELASANNDIRNLFESTRIATLFLDNELRVKNFTPATGQLFALAETGRGRPIEQVAQRFQHEHLERDVSEVIRTLQARETHVQSQEGRWYIMRILPYRSVENVIEGAVVTFSDISELKRAEHEIQRLSAAFERQLHWLKAVLDVVPVGIAYHDKGLPGVRINRTAAQVLQIPFESLQAAPDSLEYVVFPGADAAAEHAELQRTLITDVPVRDMEVEIRSGDGARHLVLNSAMLVDASSAAYGQVSAFLDITDIKRAREQAVAREQQQALIAELGLKALESVQLSEFLLDGLKTLCRVAHVDACDVMELADSGDKLRSVCRLGWNTTSTEELLTPDCAAFTAIHSGDPIFFRRTPQCSGWPEHLVEEGLESGVRILISRDGRQPFGLLGAYTRSGRPFSKSDRDFLRALALVITSAVQRQAIEEARLREREAIALRRSEEQLRRAERLASLGTFAAGIAHELNNPLNNISLAADYAEQSSDQERRDKLLTSIKDNAERCGQIVDSVLRFARNEVTQRWAVDANAIVRRSVDLVRAEFGADRLSIRLDLQEDLPNILANPTEIEQALVNLIRNAGQAHPGHCNVEIKSVLTYACVGLTVSDDGPGISAADLPRVFDPFFSTRRKQGGTGLGLSVTHRIVTSHGGRIRIGTAEGGGAQFAIELPLALEGSTNDKLTSEAGADRRG